MPTWINSQNSLAAAEAPSSKISPMEYLSNDDEHHPNHHENSQAMRRKESSSCELNGKAIEAETTISDNHQTCKINTSVKK